MMHVPTKDPSNVASSSTKKLATNSSYNLTPAVSWESEKYNVGENVVDDSSHLVDRQVDPSLRDGNNQINCKGDVANILAQWRRERQEKEKRIDEKGSFRATGEQKKNYGTIENQKESKEQRTSYSDSVFVSISDSSDNNVNTMTSSPNKRENNSEHHHEAFSHYRNLHQKTNSINTLKHEFLPYLDNSISQNDTENADSSMTDASHRRKGKGNSSHGSLDQDLSDDQTSPTSRTILNSVGRKRLHYQAKDFDNTHTYSKYHNLQPLHNAVNGGLIVGTNQSENLPDVSFISQDTDFHYLRGVNESNTNKVETCHRIQNHNIESMTSKNLRDAESKKNASINTSTCSVPPSQEKIYPRTKGVPNHNNSNTDIERRTPLYQKSVVFAAPKFSQTSVSQMNTNHSQSNSVTKVSTSLTKPLDPAHLHGSHFERELVNNKKTIEHLSTKVANISSERDEYAQKIFNATLEIMNKLQNLRLLCQDGEESDEENEPIGKWSFSDVDNEISALLKVSHLIEKDVPQLIENCTSKVCAANEELSRIQDQVSHVRQKEKDQFQKKEKKWKAIQQTMEDEKKVLDFKMQGSNKKLETIESKAIIEQNHLDKLIFSKLGVQQNIVKKEASLESLCEQIKEKQLELVDIEQLCEEHVLSAEKVIKHTEEQRQDVGKIEEEIVQKSKIIESKMKALQREKLDIKENMRLCREEREQLRLNINDIQEQSRNLEEKELSLQSTIEATDERQCNIDAVQTQLLEYGAKQAEKEEILNELQMDLNEKEEKLQHRRQEMTLLEVKLSEEIELIGSKEGKVEEQFKEINNYNKKNEMELLKLQRDKEEIEQTHQTFSKKSCALKEYERELCSDREQLVIKTNELNKDIKKMENDNEIQNNKFKIIEEQLKSREKELVNEKKAYEEKEKEVCSRLKDIEAKEVKIIKNCEVSEATFEKEKEKQNTILKEMIAKQSVEEKLLTELLNNRESTMESYKSLCADAKRVREKIKLKLVDSQSQFDLSQKNLSRNQNKIQQVQEKINLLKEEIVDCGNSKKAIGTKILEKKEMLANVESEIDSKKRDWDRISHQRENDLNISLNLQHKTANEEIAKLQNTFKLELSNKSNDLIKTYEQVSEDLVFREERLHRLNCKLMDCIKNIRIEINNQKCFRINICSERNNLQKALDNNMSELKSTQNLIIEMETKLEDKQRTLDFVQLSHTNELDSQRDNFSRKISMIETANSELLEQVGNEKDLLKSQLEILKSENVVLTRKKDSFTKEIEIETTKIKDQWHQIHMQTQELKNGKKKNDEELKNVKDSIMSSLEKEKGSLKSRMNHIDFREKELDRQESEIREKIVKSKSKESKLKKIVQSLRKNEIGIKRKEANMQSIMKLLEEKKNNFQENSDLVTELKQAAEDEQRTKKKLLENYNRMKNELEMKEGVLTQLREDIQHNKENNKGCFKLNDTESQNRLKELARQLKQKNDDLTKDQKLLTDKYKKYDECETGLISWQEELEIMSKSLHQREIELDRIKSI